MIGVINGVEFNADGSIKNLSKITLKINNTVVDITSVYRAIYQDGEVATYSGITFGRSDDTVYVIYTLSGYTKFHASSKSYPLVLSVYTTEDSTPVTSSNTLE